MWALAPRTPTPAEAGSRRRFNTEAGELSYLNLFDAEAAWRLAHEMLTLDGVGAAAAIVKHANPCGAAVEADSGDIATAYRRAFESDPLSAFGGIVALTGYVDLALAEQIVANPLADVLVARGYAEDALALLTSKRKNMRSLAAEPPTQPRLVLRQIDGGYLVQETDRLLAPRSEWRTVTKMVPSEDAWRDAEARLACLCPHVLERHRPGEPRADRRGRMRPAEPGRCCRLGGSQGRRPSRRGSGGE